MNGTSPNKCKCGSWIQHWEIFGQRNAIVCAAKTCIETDLVGAHVQKDVNNDNAWYIVPFCEEHNSATGLTNNYENKFKSKYSISLEIEYTNIDGTPKSHPMNDFAKC